MALGILCQECPLLHFQIRQSGCQTGHLRVILHDCRSIAQTAAPALLEGGKGELQLLFLQRHLGLLLFRIRQLLDQVLGFGIELHHLVGGFVHLEVFLGAVEILADTAQLLLDKADGTARLFGFEGDGPVQIDLDQGVDHGLRQFRTVVAVFDADDAGLLPDFSNLDTLAEIFNCFAELKLLQLEVISCLAFDVAEKQCDPVSAQQLPADTAADRVAVTVGYGIAVCRGQPDGVLRLFGSRAEFEDPEGQSFIPAGDLPVKMELLDDIFGIGAGFQDLQLGVYRVGAVQKQVLHQPHLPLFILDMQGGISFIKRLHKECIEGYPEEQRNKGGQEGASPPEDYIDIVLQVDLFLQRAMSRGRVLKRLIHVIPAPMDLNSLPVSLLLLAEKLYRYERLEDGADGLQRRQYLGNDIVPAAEGALRDKDDIPLLQLQR